MKKPSEIVELNDKFAEYLTLRDYKEFRMISKFFYHPPIDYFRPMLLLKIALQKENLDFLLELFERHRRLDPTIKFSGFVWYKGTALQAACCLGHLPLLRLLLSYPKIDPSIDNNSAIRPASYCGHTEVFYRLLQDQRVNPAANNNYAIQWSSYYGYYKFVCLFLNDQRVDPSANDNIAVQNSSYRGHYDVVCRLLEDQRVDPSARNNQAVKVAKINGHQRVVDRLLMDSRVVLM